MSRREPHALRQADHRTAHRAGAPNAWWSLLGIAAFLLGITLAWVGAFYASNALYGPLGLHPSLLVRQVVTSLLGIILLVIPSLVISFIVRPREEAVFRSVLAAIGRIAQGDFRTRLDTGLSNRIHPFTQLVLSINDMAEDLQRMEVLRQEFISNVSHEIQSPLTSIGGFARALHDEHLSPEQRLAYLEIIETESERLSKLSDNLLRLTALEAERPPLQPRNYRLDVQLRRVILAAEPQWQAKDIDMGVEADHLTVLADEALMEHVFANLVHNAVKFTPDGGSIRVRAEREGDALVIEVKDSGIGISPDDQERIFERFFKADRSRERSLGGSGLGLALAKKIVELHGGRIGVTSQPGHGATFRVALPETASGGAANADPR